MTMQIQARYRSYKVACQARTEFLRKREQIVVIQSAYRVYRAKQLLAKLKNEEYARNTSALIIQKNFKRFIVQKKFAEKKQAIVKIQSAIRGYLLTQCLRREFKIKQASIVKIQSVYRGYRCRHWLEKFRREMQSALRIQVTFRGFIARRRFLCLKKAAVSTQNMYRSLLLTKKIRQHFIAMRSSAVVIQSAYRAHLARKLLGRLRYERDSREQCAVRIQTFFRAHIAMRKQRTQFQRLRNAVIAIQNRFRAQQLALHMKRNMAAKRIQLCYRAYRARMLTEDIAAAIKIQSFFRGNMQRQHYKKIRHAAIVLQSWMRTILQKKRDVQRIQAASKIQSWFRNSRRMQVEQYKFRQMRKACLTIQVSCINFSSLVAKLILGIANYNLP